MELSGDSGHENRKEKKQKKRKQKGMDPKQDILHGIKAERFPK